MNEAVIVVVRRIDQSAFQRGDMDIRYDDNNSCDSLMAEQIQRILKEQDKAEELSLPYSFEGFELFEDELFVDTSQPICDQLQVFLIFCKLI